MAFVKNDIEYQQLSLCDGFNMLSERGKRVVLQSWAKSFAEVIFPAIKEEHFSVLYSSNPASRPNTPVNAIIGAMILKEMLGLTDHDVLESLVCDIRFQYALHTTSFMEQPLSDRTFSRFRERCYLYELETGIDLIKQEILSLSQVIAKTMGLNPALKRMDSLMIASNCRKMTRIEILYTCTANMAKAIQRTGEEVLLGGMEHYLDSEDRNRIIYHNKSEESDSKIQQIINDATRLLAEMGEAYFDLPEYQLLCRVIREQSVDSGDGSRKAKDKKEITADSLQNPSDPDATYREKAGKDHKGYAGQVVETFDADTGSVISGYGYEANNHSDSAFCKESIQEIGYCKEPVTMIGDGAYGGVENEEFAKKYNINLVVTALIGKTPDPVFAEFVLDEDGTGVLFCPAGNPPIKESYNQMTEQIRVVMEKSACETCPNRERCQTKMQAKTAVVNVSAKKVRRAKQAAEMKTEEYKEFSKKRNAIEGIQSVLRRKYHVDHIPVRGKIRSGLFYGFKIAAYNARKLQNYFSHQGDNSAQNTAIA